MLGGSVSGLGLLVACKPVVLHTPSSAPVASAASAPAAIEAARAPTETAPAETAPVVGEATPPQEPEPVPPAHAGEAVTPAPDDPLHGSFSLADATAGVRGRGALVATIDTELGKLECELFDDKAPLTVANFIGLARGNRPWKDQFGNWVQKPAYDGTTFHRIYKGFMIQGGDPSGTGTGEPGYPVQDEYWENARYDRAGLLCLANRGQPNSGGMQLYITDGPAPHLDHGPYGAIFGQCGPVEVVHALAAVEVDGDRPRRPPRINSVKVGRR